MVHNEHKEKIFLGKAFLEYAFNQTKIKETMLALTGIRYLMRAVMAGVIICFGYITYILINGHFNESAALAPLGHFYACGFFAFCLIFIYYAGAELLTSNMMLFSVSLYYKETTFKRMMKVLIVCYIGNLVGGLLVGLLVGSSTILGTSPTDPAIEYLQTVLATKQNYMLTMSGVYDAFIRAIFCNFFINLPMLMVYSGKIKSDVGKCLVIFGGVFIFMYLGLEHSIANTTFFALSGFLDLFNPSLEIGFNFGLAVGNVLVVLLGNFIGGGALIGIYYAFLNDRNSVLD